MKLKSTISPYIHVFCIHAGASEFLYCVVLKSNLNGFNIWKWLWNFEKETEKDFLPHSLFGPKAQLCSDPFPPHGRPTPLSPSLLLPSGPSQRLLSLLHWGAQLCSAPFPTPFLRLMVRPCLLSLSLSLMPQPHSTMSSPTFVRARHGLCSNSVSATAPNPVTLITMPTRPLITISSGPTRNRNLIALKITQVQL